MFNSAVQRIKNWVTNIFPTIRDDGRLKEAAARYLAKSMPRGLDQDERNCLTKTFVAAIAPGRGALSRRHNSVVIAWVIGLPSEIKMVDDCRTQVRRLAKTTLSDVTDTVDIGSHLEVFARNVVGLPNSVLSGGQLNLLFYEFRWSLPRDREDYNEVCRMFLVYVPQKCGTQFAQNGLLLSVWNRIDHDNLNDIFFQPIPRVDRPGPPGWFHPKFRWDQVDQVDSNFSSMPIDAVTNNILDIIKLHAALGATAIQVYAMIPTHPRRRLWIRKEKEEARRNIEEAQEELRKIHYTTCDIEQLRGGSLKTSQEEILYDEEALFKIRQHLSEAEKCFVSWQLRNLATGHWLNAQISMYERAKCRIFLQSTVDGLKTPHLKQIDYKKDILKSLLPTDELPMAARPFADSHTDCPICCEEFVRENGRIISAPAVTYNCCNRRFHAGCLLEWWLEKYAEDTKPTCPMCRKVINRAGFVGDLMEIWAREIGV